MAKEPQLYKQKREILPEWVIKGKYSVDFDSFYANDDIAKHCYNTLIKIAKRYKLNLDNYVFLEPSAGDGAFFKLLSKGKRIGIDLNPQYHGIQKMDFFDWKPNINKKYIVIGNPPFGFKGWLALRFINRATEFADLIGFILPMYFASEGKGSAKYRVKGANLLYSEELPPNSFHFNGKPIKINSVFQVWGKFNTQKEKNKSCDSFVDLYTVSTHPSRKCGLDKMNKYDAFLPSTFFSGVKLVFSFKDVKYNFGIGIIIKKDKDKIIDYLKHVDWEKYSIRSTNFSRHIGIKNIKKALVDGGFFDGR